MKDLSCLILSCLLKENKAGFEIAFIYKSYNQNIFNPLHHMPTLDSSNSVANNVKIMDRSGTII